MRLTHAATTAAIIGLIAATAPLVAQASPLSASDSCAPIQKKAKKAKRAGKKAKAKRLRVRLNTCRDAAKVRSALAGYTFTGTRGDGEPVSVTLCDNGKWHSRTGYTPVALSTGDSWYVLNPDYTSATKWVAQVSENKDPRQGGWTTGFARAGDAFQIGTASFDTVTSLGPVTRSSGAAVCATL